MNLLISSASVGCGTIGCLAIAVMFVVMCWAGGVAVVDLFTNGL